MEERPIPQSGTQSTRGTNEILVPRLRHQFMLNYTGEDGEINDSPSKTVPDQSLTVQELLLNHSRGIQSEVSGREGEYFEDTLIPQVDDITDLMQFRRDLEVQLKEVEDEIERNSKRSVDVDSSDNTDTGYSGEDKEPSSEG